MITSWKLYWITRLDAVNGLLLVLTIILVLVSVVGAMVLVAAIADGALDVRKIAGRCVLATLIMSILFGAACVLIPTTREMAAIVVIPKIANSETVQEIGGGLKELAIEWIEELKPMKPNRKRGTKK